MLSLAKKGIMGRNIPRTDIPPPGRLKKDRSAGSAALGAVYFLVGIIREGSLAVLDTAHALVVLGIGNNLAGAAYDLAAGVLPALVRCIKVGCNITRRT